MSGLPFKERRGDPRHACRVEVLCRPVGGDRAHPFHARTIDISEGGIRFALAAPFEPGLLLDMEFGHLESSKHLSRLMRVVHARANADGQWMMGGEFYQALTYEELTGLPLGR